MALGKLLRLRLFIEGIELPVVAAQVQVSFNAPAVASIQIIPLDEAMELKPRSMVHLFFLDSDSAGESDLSGYKLLFSGEVVGFATDLTPNSRSLVLQCLDFSSYWDACHATAIDWGPTGNAFYNDSALYGSNNVLFDNIVNHQPERLVGWLNSTPKTPGLTKVGGLAGGIIRMLEAIGGVPGHERGVNDFFGVAELRCKILEQITAEENDNTASRLLDKRVFEEWLKNGIQNIGLQVTFRDMMKLLFNYIYYDMVPNPAAKYSEFKEGVTLPGKRPTTTLKSNPIISASITRLNKIKSNLIAKSSSRDAKSTKAEVLTYIKELKKEESTIKLVKSSDALRAATSISMAYTALESKVNLPQPGDFGIDAAVQRLDEVEKIIQNSSNKVISGSIQEGTSSVNVRLHSQIMRPDCFFVAPPRCNVIFPEDYAQLSYNRVFTSEVTRSQLLLYNALIAEGDRMFATSVVSPFMSKEAAASIKGAGTTGYRSLMPHELHTGIIPRSEWLSNTVAFDGKADTAVIEDKRRSRLGWMKRASLFHFFRWRYASRTASITGRFMPRLVCGFPALIVTKPFFADIKGDSSSDTLSKVQSAAEESGPSHLLGMVTSLVHSVSQDGGITSASLTHVRKHKGVDDELLDILSKNKSKKKVVLKIPIKYTTEDKKELKFLAELTPQQKPTSRTKVRQVSSVPSTAKAVSYTMENGIQVETESVLSVQKRVETRIDPGQAPQVTKNVVIEGVTGTYTIPSGKPKKHRGSKGLRGTVLGVSVEDDSLATTEFGSVFKSVVVFEEVEVNITTETPIEENIRPDWFSSSYSNSLIGANIYDPFFGCGSIVDDLVVGGIEGLPDGLDVTALAGQVEITAPTTRTLDDVAKEVSTTEELRSRISVEKASNIIGFLYGNVRSEGLNVDRFITDFTYRPIATLEDIMGDNVILTMAGSTITNFTGKLGFHTLSVHEDTVNAGDLSGLLTDPQLKVPRILDSGASKAIPSGYDVRKQKRDAVLRYYDALKKGPAFIG